MEVVQDQEHMSDAADRESNISPLERKILNQAKIDNPTRQNTLDLFKEFKESLKTSDDFQRDGLLAYMLLITAESFFTHQEVALLESLVYDARELKGGVVDKTLDRLQVMQQEVDGYFRHKSHPYDYFQVSTVDHPLAMSVLSVGAEIIASRKRQELEARGEKGMVVKSFVNPKNHEPGVWMSVKGMPYDPSAVIK